MTRDELADFVYERTGELESKAAARRVLKGVFAAITEALESGEEVVLHEFGRFILKPRKERSGTAPDGTEWTKPAGKSVQFKPSPALKRAADR